MDAITIKINGKDWLIKQTFRSYLLFEEMSGKQVGDIKTMKDFLLLLYCSFKGSNKDFGYSFEEFIDVCDEDPTIFTRFNEFNESQAIQPEKKKKEKG